MRIGILAGELTHQDGWAHYSLSVIRALKQAGIRLTILAPLATPIPEDLRDMPVHPILPPLRSIGRRLIVSQFALAPRARALLADCDLIHAFVEPYAPLARVIAGTRPLIITGHGSYTRLDRAYPFPFAPLYRWAFRGAVIACVSRYTVGVMERALPGVKTFVIGNGIDVERFAALPGVPKTGRLILSVGAIKPRKGTLDLVRAMPAVLAVHPDAQCSAVGSLEIDRAYVEQVRDEIASLGLSESIDLTGRVSDAALLDLYARADVFAFPSVNEGWRFEGFGLAALEASAAGIPVVAAGGSGVEDAVEHGVTGLIVPQRDPAALGAAINRLLNDPELREQMGAAGREKARAATWDAAASHLIRLYTAALNGDYNQARQR